MNINAGLEYDFGWNKWLKGLKLKFSYSKSINSTKNNQYGSSYELYYMSKRAGSEIICIHLSKGRNLFMKSCWQKTISY